MNDLLAILQAATAVLLFGATVLYVEHTRRIRAANEMSAKSQERALLATAHSAVYQRLDRINEILISMPDLFDELRKPKPSDVEDPLPYTAAYHLMGMLFTLFEEIYFQRQVFGIMGDEVFDSWVRIERGLISLPYVRAYWLQRKQSYPSNFSRHIDDLLASLSTELTFG